MGRKKTTPEPESDLQAKLEKEKQEILKRAEALEASDNYFFRTTFERYETQLIILSRLKDEAEHGDILIEKQYVKGSSNLCINPAITEFNRTASAANGTVSALVKILNSIEMDGSDGPGDALLDFALK